jgi:hypothetical protein
MANKRKSGFVDVVMAMPSARAGGPLGLSHAALSQPKALIAIAESFGEYASMCFAGFKPGGQNGKGKR